MKQFHDTLLLAQASTVFPQKMAGRMNCFLLIKGVE